MKYKYYLDATIDWSIINIIYIDTDLYSVFYFTRVRMHWKQTIMQYNLKTESK